jgi:hypothetical protein
MIFPILLSLAAAIVVTWLIVWWLRSREEKTKINALNTQLAANNLSIKKDAVRYEWVAVAPVDDEQFNDMNASVVMLGDKMKLLIDVDNFTELHKDNHLLHKLNEALHTSNDDFDQRIIQLEDDKTSLERML